MTTTAKKRPKKGAKKRAAKREQPRQRVLGVPVRAPKKRARAAEEPPKGPPNVLRAQAEDAERTIPCPTCRAAAGSPCVQDGRATAVSTVAGGMHPKRWRAYERALNAKTSPPAPAPPPPRDAKARIEAAIEKSWATECPECGAAPGKPCTTPGGAELDSFATMHARRRAISDEDIAALGLEPPHAPGDRTDVACPTCGVSIGAACVPVASGEGKRRPLPSGHVHTARQVAHQRARAVPHGAEQRAKTKARTDPASDPCYECGHAECPIYPDCSECKACAAARDPEVERRADEANARIEREIEEIDSSSGRPQRRTPRTTVEYDGDAGPEEPTYEHEPSHVDDEGMQADDERAASAGAGERVEARGTTAPECIGGHEVHPVASIFPLIEDADLEELARDIAENGLHEAIWRLPDGRILDGRNRLRACLRAGVSPTFRGYEGPTDMATLVAFVKSLNLARRHLNESQRALVAARALPLLEAEAKARQREGAARGGKSAGKLPADLPEASRSRGEAREHAARELGVSARLVQDAKTVEAHAAPEVKRAVERGDLRVSAAAELSKLDHETQREILERSKGKPGTVRALKRQHDREQLAKELNAKPVPIAAEGPFHVIAADPSWRFDLRDSDASHRGITPYPTMSTEEICNLLIGGKRVAELGHADSVLFLWTTNAHMRDAYDVAAAWGYEPKTIGTWVKPKLGLGHYLRSQTEHFLVCVRGSPVITLTNQSNVITAPAREHSRKPDEFYALVESLCPGSKLELFAREPRPGWARWGAETEMFERAS